MIKKYIKIFILISILIHLTNARPDPLFNFAWLTDTHVSARSGAVDLRAAVLDVNQIGNIDFVIVSGDITELDINGYLDTAKTILEMLDVPYYIIPGNHDTKWSSSGTQKFPKLFGDSRFNFEYKGIRFIGVHQGPLLRMGDGYIAPEDLRWLEKSLQEMKDPRQPIFLVTHYPIDNSVSNWYEYLSIVKPYNIQAILHGHGHRNRLTEYEGIPGLMSRSTLKGRAEAGGYTLAAVYPDSIVFRERQTGIKTLEAWACLAITEKDYTCDTTQYPRPDFTINRQFSNVKEIWAKQLDWAIAASPAVSKKAVVSANSGGFVQAFRISDGREIWKFKTGNAVYSSPAVSRNRVVFGVTDSMIYCLNIRNGKLLWKVKTGAPVLGVPTIYKNVVYIGSSDRIFRAINLRNGKFKWDFDGVDGFVESKPYIYDDKVIFGAWDNKLYALNVGTGSLLWKWSDGTKGLLYSPAAVWPVATMGKVFIATPDRYMSCINANTGITLWRSNRFKVRETVGISGDKSVVFARTMWDTVFAIDPIADSLVTVWVDSVGYGYDIDPSMPIEKDGTLFFGTKDGFVYALDAETGATKGIHRIGVALINTVVPIDNRMVVATSMDGKVVMLEFQ
ncbi:MAG: PQQ-binding-like beta-propeller repeat protein [Candidatus Marinimicrobia bacterium]|nr:PQQ-binding-like beta-propeller repeat protein [Candidatus Neomarinimicrobiota bacterium]